MRRPTRIACVCLLALSGCVDSKKGPVELAFPFTFDTGSVRCPPVDQVAKNEARRTTERPDHWGMGPATAGDMMELVDKHEISEARKNGTLKQLIAEYERCRSGAPPPSSPKRAPTS